MNKINRILTVLGGLFLVLFSWVTPVFAAAAKTPKFVPGNIAWVLASTALVLIITTMIK